MEAVASSATIPPGGSGYILTTFDRPMVGMRDLLIRVGSNDPAHPEQILTLRFEIVP